MWPARNAIADTERAFAKTMADRDFAAFKSFLADDAIFFSGPAPLRGKERVAAAWPRFYEKPEAPFSWQPEQVQVLESGELALSTGPVRDPKGKLFATFTSIWRREAPGQRIIFDKGNDVCDCASHEWRGAGIAGGRIGAVASNGRWTRFGRSITACLAA
jgi:ketosteroid isomerase-like protein